MNRSQYAVSFLLVLALVFGVFWIGAVAIENTDKERRCEARGGTWFCPRYSCVCLARGAVLP